MFRVWMLVLVLVGVCLLPVSALVYPSIEWNRTYGGTDVEKAYDLVVVENPTTDEYVYAGYSGDKAYIGKVNWNGDLVWEKVFTSDTFFNSITPTEDGKFVVTGTRCYSGLFGGIVCSVYLVKTSDYGVVDWEREYYYGQLGCGGNSVDEAGNKYVVAGYCRNQYSFSYTDYDVYVVAVDRDGNKLWERKFGGDYDDRAYSVVTLRENPFWGGLVTGYLVVGWTESYGNGGADFYIVKLDESGNEVWNRTFGSSGNDYAYSAVRTYDGYIIVGYGSALLGYSVKVLKLDEDGNFVWQKTIGGVAGRDAYAYSIHETDYGYIIAGAVEGLGGDLNAQIWAIDEDGNLIWQKTFGGSENDVAYSAIPTRDGYIVAGWTESYGNGNSDVWLVKLTREEYLHPVANFTYTASGLTVTFDASSSYDDDGYIVNYTWNFGDGSSETTSQPTIQHTYSQPGTYQVTLTVTDNDGLVSTVDSSVTVSLGESIPDNVDDALEQLVSKYYPDFDWKTDTPTRQDVLNAVVNAVAQYFSTSDQAARQEILNDVVQLVALYFTL